MKKFTHPIKRQTRIRFTNGASFNKHWNYYRPLLNADNNIKSIESSFKKQNTTSVVTNFNEKVTNQNVKSIISDKVTVSNTQDFDFEFTFNIENKLKFNGYLFSAVFV